MKELEIKLRWQNNDSFEMTCKCEDIGSVWLTVVKLEENGEVAALWPHIQKACQTFLAQRLRAIGREMVT